MTCLVPQVRTLSPPVSKRLTREGRLGKPQCRPRWDSQRQSLFSIQGKAARCSEQRAGKSPGGTALTGHGAPDTADSHTGGPSRSRSPQEVCRSPRAGPEARPVRGTRGDPGGRHTASPHASLGPESSAVPRARAGRSEQAVLYPPHPRRRPTGLTPFTSVTFKTCFKSTSATMLASFLLRPIIKGVNSASVFLSSSF